jgi:N-(2-amino-2-carboxyethyl)-L-glutamate synthase
MYNPGGSIKDRPATKMILSAIKKGTINKNTTIIESSSGNMAIGLAQICSLYKLPLICVVDPKITNSNLQILKAYGAKIEMIKHPSSVTNEYLHARIEKVKELLKIYPNSFWTNQYANKQNYLSHEITMKEISQQLNKKIDYLFCATSTCGTIRGCSNYIKKNKMPTKIIAIDAIGSIIFGGKRSNRLIPGHGASIRPNIYKKDMVDDVVYISDKECITGCKLLLKQESIFAGGSSGAVIIGIKKYIKKIQQNKNVVIIFS